MFVFAGFQVDKAKDSLSTLIEALHKTFLEKQLSVSFTKKDKLLTLRFEDVNFYISIFSDEKEVKDWYQMAKDFELTTKPNPIDTTEFENRLRKKQLRQPGLYKEGDYVLGRVIYTEIGKLDLSRIYFFF